MRMEHSIDRLKIEHIEISAVETSSEIIFQSSHLMSVKWEGADKD